MFSENEYFLTIECQMYDNKLNSWHDAWSSAELVKKRVENGVTYCAWSKNRKNGNHISACFKFNDKEQMEKYEDMIKEVVAEKKEQWSRMGDLSSMDKNRWHILKECMIDTNVMGVLNETDDVFWFAKHKVDDVKHWVNSAVETTKMGAWNNVRWWGLMQNVDNENEVACCLRIPRKNMESLLSDCWENLGAWRQMMSINVEGMNLRFYDVQYETMYNRPPSMPEEVWEQIIKKTGHRAVCGMRKSNLEILKEMHNHWANGRVDELLQNVSEDCVLTHHGDERVPFLGTFKGREGMKTWIQYYAKEVTHLSTPVMSDYADMGDYVYHQYSAKLKVNLTNNEVDAFSINKIKFNDEGKVVEMSFCGNTNDILEAYGDSFVIPSHK